MAAPESSDAGKAPPAVGSYRLLQPLGSGGMSSVFRAVHLDTGHEVAVKVLPRTLARNPTLLQRFLREAKNAESLEHPSIAAIYDRGFDQGRHYLVLEYVPGGDLHERVRASGPLPLAEAVHVIRSTAEALDYAAGRGVIHRDVKPANLLMTPEGRVKLIDLGLALQAEAEDERVTRDGTTVGTVDYMAPEQARDSRATSSRSDIYSLGCTLYFLITGAPPYPGGNVPDKLGRHCTAPIPDARKLRPEASEQLGRLLRRMMAKKPEARFPDYAALVSALDALPESHGASGPVLDALIADDDDEIPDALIADDDEIVLAPEPGAPPSRPRDPANVPRPSQSKGGRPPERPAAGPPEVSLSLLAGLEDDAPAVRSTRAPATPWEDDELRHAPAGGTMRASSREVPLSTWIAAGAVLGLAIALIGFGLLHFLGPNRSDGAQADRPVEAEQGGGPLVEAPTPVAAPIVRAPAPSPPTPKPVPVDSAPAPSARPEPAEPAVANVLEPVYPDEVEASLLPEWMRKPDQPAGGGPVITVRRIPSASDATDVSGLRSALDANGAVVEIADNGPFFEDDFRIPGKSRTIRARPGFRPVIMVKPSTSALVRDRSSVFSLDGTRLVLDGVDLVIDAQALPQPLGVVFHLKGAELTLNRCTVTVLNADQHPLSLVRLDEPADQRSIRSSQVRVEGSLLRGASPAVFDVGGSAELAIVRSVVIGGDEAIVVHRPTTPRDPRRYYIARSLLASRSSVLDVPGGRSPAAFVRSLGSTFAKVDGLDGSGLIHARADAAGGPAAALDWLGHDDAFVGWPSWMDAGPRPKVLVADLASARQTWKTMDPTARESRRGWPIDDLATPASMASLPESRPAVLARVAEPQESLLDSTVGSFPRPPMPRGSAAPAATDGPGSSSELSFDVTDPSWRGDLGLFLARRVSPGAGHVVVKVVGGGTWPMTPVRLPDGASVAVESPSQQGPGPTWVAVPGSVAPALLEVQKGDLSLTGVTLGWSPSARVARLIRVEDGHLSLSCCALKGGDSPMPAGSGLVLFRASGTRPIPGRPWPFAPPVDRPICSLSNCLLMAVGGEAIAAELGRGAVDLVNTAIISEGDGAAIALRPQKVARSRLDADLGLDHCSIAAERDFVRIGPWPGADPGPARPWLVSSRKTAFLEISARGRRGSVLLRSVGNGLAHGAVAWQADGDAYDLAHFTASGASEPVSGHQKPDVKALWVDFWGPRHIQNVVGPNPRRDGAVLLTRDRLRPGGLTVGDLRLDPKAHPDLGVDSRLLPSATARTVPIPF